MNSILNRKHAKEIIKNEGLLKKWFTNINNSDEHCYITLLHYLNLQNELKMTPNTAYTATTYAPWSNMSDYKVFKNSVKENEYTYNKICDEELEYLVNAKCLFARKFKPECNLNFLEELLNIKIILKYQRSYIIHIQLMNF